MKLIPKKHGKRNNVWLTKKEKGTSNQHAHKSILHQFALLSKQQVDRKKTHNSINVPKKNKGMYTCNYFNNLSTDHHGINPPPKQNRKKEGKG